MPSPAASFESFQAEPHRLVGLFEQHLAHYKNPDYEAANRFLVKPRREMADAKNPRTGTPMPTGIAPAPA